MKKINFGIIGFGYFGKFHAKVLGEIKRARLVAIADKNISSISGEVADIEKFSDPKKLLQNKDIDSVIIVTPPSTHLSLLKEAAAFGKNVFVEKPLVSTSEELREFKRVFGNYQKCFMLGHIYLYSEYINRIKKMISDGALGNLRLIKMSQNHLGPIRRDVSCFREIGTHQISILDYILEGEKPKIRSAMSSSISGNDNGDAVFIGLKYGDVDVHINLSWYSPEKEKKMVFIGEKGIIVFDDVSKRLLFQKIKYPDIRGKGNQSIWLNKGKESVDLFGGRVAHNPQKKELEHFIDCLINKKQPISGFDHAVRTAEIIDNISKKL